MVSDDLVYEHLNDEQIFEKIQQQKLVQTAVMVVAFPLHTTTMWPWLWVWEEGTSLPRAEAQIIWHIHVAQNAFTSIFHMYGLLFGCNAQTLRSDKNLTAYCISGTE